MRLRLLWGRALDGRLGLERRFRLLAKLHPMSILDLSFGKATVQWLSKIVENVERWMVVLKISWCVAASHSDRVPVVC